MSSPSAIPWRSPGSGASLRPMRQLGSSKRSRSRGCSGGGDERSRS
jgi:hypothetical protein